MTTFHEDVMKEMYYKDWYKIWVRNFALNLNDIWLEKSAKSLIPSLFPESSISIVIGKGPSAKKHDHFKLLAESNFKGTIVCTDGALITALKNGITPVKFPKFFVVTIDPKENIQKYYDDPIVREFGEKINGIYSTVTDPHVIQKAKDAEIKIHWVHPLFDFEEGEKSFNNISALMVRAKNCDHGLPAIQTGGNVGTASWFVAWRILHCNIVALIGINHGWEDDDPWDLIVSHGHEYETPKIQRNDKVSKKLFPRIYNPDFDSYCILDPIFQYYSNGLKEFIKRSPDWLTTINATEGGSIFGDRVKSLRFSTFLANRS